MIDNVIFKISQCNWTNFVTRDAEREFDLSILTPFPCTMLGVAVQYY